MLNEPKSRVRAGEIDMETTPFLDVREHTGGEQIRGAVRYNPKTLLREAALILPLPHEAPIAVYGDTEEAAEAIVHKLRSQGYNQAAVLEGGFDAYRDAGLPVEELTQEQPVPGTDAGINRV